ncbi:MAG: apolipoprotein N-acyltransferase [Acidimicrobiia bacterium]
MIPFLLAASAGLAFVVAFPPYSIGLASFVGATLFWLAVRRSATAWRAAAAGFLAGFVFYGLLMWWIANLGWVAWVPLTLALAAFPAIAALVGSAFRSRSDWVWVITAAAGWGLLELIRVRFPLGGLPWGALGFTMGDYAVTRSATQWIGTSGWTVVIVAAGAAAALAIERRRWQLMIPMAAIVAGLALIGWISTPGADGTELRVAIVQAENPCPATHCVGERQTVYRNHLELTRESVSPGEVDLVVWAESSAGFLTDPAINPEVASEVAAEARRLGSYLIMGSDRPVGEDQFVNVNILFSPDGEVVDEYRKVHPVPFGEYVPARPLFDWIPELDRVPRDMIPGAGPVVFQLPQGSFGSVISFEAAFHRYFRDHVAAGADLMVVATNQSSYGMAPAADQLIGITRMRAAELGIDIAHSAVTGRSTFIDAAGETGYRTGLYRAEVIKETLRFSQGGDTLYFRLRDWVVLVLIGLAVVFEIRRRVAAREAARVGP